MKRGEIWTMAGGPGYASKPRPAVIIQDDCFPETLSIAVCPLTSEPIEAPILRIQVEPTPDNGLRATSRLMVPLCQESCPPGLTSPPGGQPNQYETDL
jgi:mRNA interferase MazF